MKDTNDKKGPRDNFRLGKIESYVANGAATAQLANFVECVTIASSDHHSSSIVFQAFHAAPSMQQKYATFDRVSIN